MTGKGRAALLSLVALPVVLLSTLMLLGWRVSPSTTGPSVLGAGVPQTEVLCDVRRARVSAREWRTDFGRCTVPLEEFMSGGPGRDGIPPIDTPKFESVTSASAWLNAREPVIYVEIGGEAVAYPLQILIWHEIVNDVVGAVPAAVTFCPLCNTAIVFDRRLDGRLLDFGTTGNLRHSDLVMWDRQTESWWQQATGEALVGKLAGNRLTMLPGAVIAWGEFQRQRPTGRVLSRDTGYRRDYGRNPYVGYDAVDQPPFLFRGSVDGRLSPMERVVTVSLAGEHVGYPFLRLRDRGVIADTVGGIPIAVFYDAGTASALDAATIISSREVGSSAVYQRTLDDFSLAFERRGGDFVDLETASRWTFLGEAMDGPFAGRRLTPIPHTDAFWFASAAFFPTIRIWAP